MADKRLPGGLLAALGILVLIFVLGDKGVAALRQTVPAAQNLMTLSGTLQDESEDATGASHHGLFLKTPLKTVALCIPQGMWPLVSDSQLHELLNKPVSVWTDVLAKPAYEADDVAPQSTCTAILDLRSGTQVLFDYDTAKTFILVNAKIFGIGMLVFCVALFFGLVVVIGKTFNARPSA
jgi:hypothetical protein